VLLVDWDMQTVRGKLGHAPSKWFGRYKTKLGITDTRKTFHNFRHTLFDDLRGTKTVR
jgi:integrase